MTAVLEGLPGLKSMRFQRRTERIDKKGAETRRV